MADTETTAVEPTDKEEKKGGPKSPLQQWIALGALLATFGAVVVIYRQTCEKSLTQQRESQERLEAIAVEELRKRQAADHAAATNDKPQKLPVRPVVVHESEAPAEAETTA